MSPSTPASGRSPDPTFPGIDSGNTTRPGAGLDALLERKITQASNACTSALERGDRAAARSAWAKFRALLLQRSPEQIERLERARGLRG